MPTQIDSSLRPSDRRFPIGNVTSHGNYRTSIGRAEFYTLTQGVPTASSFSHTVTGGGQDPTAEDSLGFDVLLFGQDAPSSLQLNSMYAGIVVDDGASTIPQVWFSVTGLLDGDETILPSQYNSETAYQSATCSLLNNQDPALAEYQQGIAGTTVTNAVEVEGVPLAMQVFGRGLFTSLDGGDPTASVPAPLFLSLGFSTQADILDGWAPAVLVDGNDTVEIHNVILDESVYTAAMRQAGNIIDHVAGGTTTRLFIVGLYASAEGQEGFVPRDLIGGLFGGFGMDVI